MPDVGFKHQLFSQFARVGKALGNANRLEMLEFLAQGEHSVETLAASAKLSVANASQHLQQLRQAGLVQSRRDGVRIYYALAGDDVIGLIGLLRRVAERHLAEVDRLVLSYLTVRDSLEPLAAPDLLQRARSGQVTVLDVRPVTEYRAGHVPGAINIPLKDLEHRLAELPISRDVVAYCRGPYCVLAFEAVAQLRAKGYRALRLQDGFPEWKHSGLPVETSS